MSHDFHLKQLPPVLQAPKPIIETPGVQLPLAEPTPEQIQAADAAFAGYEEHTSLTDFIGLYTGALMLHDLAKETFRSPAEEEEPQEKEPEEEA